MQNTTLVYLDSYALDEANTLLQLGLPVLRLQKGDLPFFKVRDESGKNQPVVLRGGKTSINDYSELYRRLEVAELRCRTSPTCFAILSDSAEYENIIPDHVPMKEIFDLTSIDAVKKLRQLSSWGKLFIRSELGSAAKFSGLESCVISSFTIEEISTKILRLQEAFPQAKKLLARAVEDIRQQAGKPTEGRFVVLGQSCYLDHYEVDDVNSRHAFESRFLAEAQDVALKFHRAGVYGDFFLDIAEKATGGWFVVEIKPLLNGTIRNFEGLAQILKTLRPI